MRRLQNRRNRINEIDSRTSEIDRKLIDPFINPIEKAMMLSERRRLEDEKTSVIMQIERETNSKSFSYNN